MYTVKTLKDVYATKLAVQFREYHTRRNKKNLNTKMKSLRIITDKTKRDRLRN